MHIAITGRLVVVGILKTFVDNTDGARLNKALNSPEYGLYMVAQKIDLCLENVNGVIESISVPEQNEVEMFFWLKMINCFDGSNSTFRYLQQANIQVTSDPFYEGTDKIYAGWTNIEQDIIVNKVTVRAMADAMGWTISKD
ncbi:hypothetical protein RUE5091_04438 [Ruegeria denitrificans]|uniref:Uncharacterized protein n=1 Tax=Ruegeria denitrificans TaxID=1715692 RepID=A0A0P1IKP0_9RHOB|nr:hypothetical protein [Ruegeria denitrificans]CUK19858.1 hypothetical protein RUE5091_04438 [Ruegeria denitrificans]